MKIRLEDQPGGSTNFDVMCSMTMEQMAMTMACPNETGLGVIECDQADDKDCFACCLNWLKQPAAKCRICGCTAITPCPGGCSWAEPDLCSRCAIADAFQRRRGPDISITPHKPGNGGILCMPMAANIPEPGRADWRPMDCPVCGRECWQSDAHRQALAAEPSLQAACTMCALQAGLKQEQGGAGCGRLIGTVFGPAGGL